LARDGKFLMELFDCFLDYKKLNSVSTHYMYVSRSSVINATLKEIDEEKFEWVQPYKKISINSFLRALQFSSEEIAILNHNFDGNELIDSFLQSNSFSALKRDKTFREIYECKRKEKHDNFIKYLNDSGFYSAKKTAIVDLGWNGTIQDNINKVFNSREFVGYYLGCLSHKDDMDNIKIGLLFHGEDWRNPVRVCNYNFEYICAADHGSTYSYDQNGKPLLVDGNEVFLYEKYYKKIQQDIKDKFIEIMREVSDKHYASLEHYVMSRHAKMLLNLKSEEKRMFSATVKVWGDLIDVKTSRKTIEIVKIFLHKIKIFLVLKYDQRVYDKKLYTNRDYYN
jgi:hypothetical protein